MKTLTAKEEEVMELFWEKGPLFVKQLLEFYEEPRPHFNTLKGVISKYFNNSYMGVVSSLVKEEEISIEELKELIRKVEEGN